MPEVDEIEISAGAASITRHYGAVIGDEQARNIAYYALLGARQAKAAKSQEDAEKKRRADYRHSQNFFNQG